MPDLSLFDISGKKALVTGGSIGIGRGCATALAKGGADVAIVARNEEIGKKTAEALKEMGVNSFFVQCDVSNKQQIETMVSTVVERFGRLDIAINNAGTGILCEDEFYPKEYWDKTIDINLTGLWLCAQAQAQQMVRQMPMEGKIINIASIAATTNIHMGSTNAEAYFVSKAGVVHLTKVLAARWGRYNINVNSISPSYVMTPLFSDFPFELRQRIRETTPLGYVQRPKDLYGPVLFLASEASNYVTGHNLIVDGGHTLSLSVDPFERSVSPRVSSEEEVIELKKDFDSMGISYDENGIKLS